MTIVNIGSDSLDFHTQNEEIYMIFMALVSAMMLMQILIEISIMIGEVRCFVKLSNEAIKSVTL